VKGPGGEEKFSHPPSLQTSLVRWTNTHAAPMLELSVGPRPRWRCFRPPCSAITSTSTISAARSSIAISCNGQCACDDLPEGTPAPVRKSARLPGRSDSQSGARGIERVMNAVQHTTATTRSSGGGGPASIRMAKGSKAADLPVHAPKDMLIINLKTAKAFGRPIISEAETFDCDDSCARFAMCCVRNRACESANWPGPVAGRVFLCRRTCERRQCRGGARPTSCG
jgi:hypothetical protein